MEQSQNLNKGTLELIDWLKKAQPFYKKSVETIKRWFAFILGYFEQRTTNAIVEGINNKLKMLKRCGFGFRNFINFKMRALLFWHFPNNLAQELRMNPVVLASIPEPDKVSLVAAFSREVNKKGLQAGKFIEKIAQICGSKGGGRPNLAQAGGRDASKLQEALESARNLLFI